MINVVSWILAIRLKTCIASLGPVIVGVLLSRLTGEVNVFLAGVTLLCALCLQIGTNFANDYYDFIKGADTRKRKGPQRMVQAGRIKPLVMKRAAIGMFVVAFCLGMVLVFFAGWVIFVIGIVSIFLGWGYTAGRFALAYTGFADVIAFLFFGPVAVCGTVYIQLGVFSVEAAIIGVGFGALSTALLTVNNVRDVHEDAACGKKTLVVRLGQVYGRVQYALCLGLSVWVVWQAVFFTGSAGRVGVLCYAAFCLNLSRLIWDVNEECLNRVLSLTGVALMLFTGVLVLGVV